MARSELKERRVEKVRKTSGRVRCRFTTTTVLTLPVSTATPLTTTTFFELSTAFAIEQAAASTFPTSTTTSKGTSL